MNAHIRPSSLGGSVSAVSSKSMAHRLLILAALADEPTEFVCDTFSEDIEATSRCLRVINDERRRGFDANGAGCERIALDCGESGSTLRFLLPVVCALGMPACFIRRGRLPERPLDALAQQLALHGITIEEHGRQLDTAGKMSAGTFTLPGDVSSQYASGLLMAATIMDEPVEVLVSTPVQSRPYLELTVHALMQFGRDVRCDKVIRDGVEYERFVVDPAPFAVPERCVVEGDWSNAAFWLAAGSLEPEGLTVCGLDPQSAQGDRAIVAALAGFGARIARKGTAVRATADAPRAAVLDVSAFPDLVPPLAAVAATAPGTSRLTNAGRLRLKESDRLKAITCAITRLGGHAQAVGDDLVIEGVEQLGGGTIDACNDHRIAMMGAILATHAKGEVVITDARCVSKSYPGFWEDYALLGGSVHLTRESEDTL